MIDDGTSWDFSQLAAIRARLHYGHGYRSESLEAKRRAAIEWLRECSTVGWACDKVKEKTNG